MPRLVLLLLLLSMGILLPESGRAESDTARLVNLFATEQFEEQVRDISLQAHARQLAGLLKTRSVTTSDVEALAKRLPPRLGDQAAASMRAEIRNLLSTKVSPDLAARLVDHLRGHDADRLEHGFEDAQNLEAWVEQLQSEAFRTEIDLMSLSVSIFMRVHMVATSDVEIDLREPFVADLLEDQGDLFVFPNRIWRKDLIRELRKAGS